ncbi:MAG: hypothetical protein ACO3F8_00680 [Holophagaceae bacterium]
MIAMQRWEEELSRPTEDFFSAYVNISQNDQDLILAVRSAVKVLVPVIDWPGFLPHMPHGLLGLSSIFRLRGILDARSFRRALGTQLHYFAQEGRATSAKKPLMGSGSFQNIKLGIQKQLPEIAFGEVMGINVPTDDDFDSLVSLVKKDMSNMGHKMVFIHHMKYLFIQLGRPKATGRWLLGICAWLAACAPDTFWNERAQKRLDQVPSRPLAGSMVFAPEDTTRLRKAVNEFGLVQMLNEWTSATADGLHSAEMLKVLLLSSSDKILDARRDLEGKTSWLFTYLESLWFSDDAKSDLAVWSQAAALVNLFPSEEDSSRMSTLIEGSGSNVKLSDAILDVEPQKAFSIAHSSLNTANLSADVEREVALAVSWGDPIYNYSHHSLALASLIHLRGHIEPQVWNYAMCSLCKSLANSQGSSDLSRQLDRLLG